MFQSNSLTDFSIKELFTSIAYLQNINEFKLSLSSIQEKTNKMLGNKETAKFSEFKHIDVYGIQNSKYIYIYIIKIILYMYKG